MKYQGLLFVLPLALASLLAGSGCGPLPGKPTAADVEIKPRDVMNFALLYGQNCAGCHGRNGEGNTALGLANPVYLALASDEIMRRAISNGVPGTLMTPFGRGAGGMLSDGQINLLVAEMRKRWARPDFLAGATLPPYAPAGAGDIKRGEEAYKTYCLACHGPGGKGKTGTGSIVDTTFLALVSDQSLRLTVIAGRPDQGHPDWRHYLPGKALTDQQVTDVVAWLVSHRSPTPGQPYPVAKEP